MPLPENPVHGATALFPTVDETSCARNDARIAILELANMISIPMALNAVVRLNVADAIWSNGANFPLSADQILPLLPTATATSDSENLQRILRMLSSYGVFLEHLSHNSATSSVERR